MTGRSYHFRPPLLQAPRYYWSLSLHHMKEKFDQFAPMRFVQPYPDGSQSANHPIRLRGSMATNPSILVLVMLLITLFLCPVVVCVLPGLSTPAPPRLYLTFAS